MNLTDLSKNIEREIHVDHKLSDTTKERIKLAVESRRGQLKGGSRTAGTYPEGPRAPIGPLTGFDVALIGSLNNNIPIKDPSLKSEVMGDIITNGQRIMPNTANVYYSYLLNDRKQLASTVNESLDRIEAMRGGALEGHLYKILGSAVLIVLLLTIYVVVSQKMGPKKEGFTYAEGDDGTVESFVIVEDVIDETGINY